jgi:hypothetical protein
VFSCWTDVLNMIQSKDMHTEGILLPDTEETYTMRVLQSTEVKTVSGAGLLTSVVKTGAKGLYYVGKGLVQTTGTLFRILI